MSEPKVGEIKPPATLADLAKKHAGNLPGYAAEIKEALGNAQGKAEAMRAQEQQRQLAFAQAMDGQVQHVAALSGALEAIEALIVPAARPETAAAGA